MSRPADPEQPFWRIKALEDLTAPEWESLCDGCGRCCLIKLEDEDSGEVHYTDVGCTLLDAGTCRCRDYERRQQQVPDCLRLTPQVVRSTSWLPATCGYRLVAEGRDLAWWHPLVSGTADTVHEAGISVRGRVAGHEGDFTDDELLDPRHRLTCGRTGERGSELPLSSSVLRSEAGRGFARSAPPVQTVSFQTKELSMGFFTSPIKTMDDLYSHTLQDIYYAEHQITKALPKMIDKASNPALKQAFQKHLGETEQQVKRLEEVFKILGKDAKGVTCPAIDGIIKEADELISDCDDHEVRDAAMVAAAQAVEHYEITRYGTLIAWSKQLGKQNVASLLHQTLTEEKATDEKLTQLAESNVNKKAA